MTTEAPYAVEVDAEVGDFVYFFSTVEPHADASIAGATFGELEPDLIPAPGPHGIRAVIRLDRDGTRLAVFVRGARSGCWQVASVSATVEPERVVLTATGGGYDEFAGCVEASGVASFLIVEVPGGVGDRIIVQDECGYDGCLRADGSSELAPTRSVLVGCQLQGTEGAVVDPRWRDRIEICDEAGFEADFPVFGAEE